MAVASRFDPVWALATWGGWHSLEQVGTQMYGAQSKAPVYGNQDGAQQVYGYGQESETGRRYNGYYNASEAQQGVRDSWRDLSRLVFQVSRNESISARD